MLASQIVIGRNVDVCNCSVICSVLVQVFSEAAMRHNIGVLEYSRTCQAAAAGMASGILGLTGISGFIFYFILVILQVMCLYMNMPYFLSLN